jgi:hypothetical protein
MPQMELRLHPWVETTGASALSEVAAHRGQSIRLLRSATPTFSNSLDGLSRYAPLPSVNQRSSAATGSPVQISSTPCRA